MDSRIVYTTEAGRLWGALEDAAQRSAGAVHGAPPEMAIEVSDARLYVAEGAPGDELPLSAHRLGIGVRQFVIDVHNAPAAERFLADAIEGIVAVVDDDEGCVMDGADFVAAVRGRQ